MNPYREATPPPPSDDCPSCGGAGDREGPYGDEECPPCKGSGKRATQCMSVEQKEKTR